MSYETMEQEISLKGILFAVLRRWKGMLIWGIVLAVLLGGARGFLTWRQTSAPDHLKALQEAYETAMEEYELERELHENQLEMLRNDIELQQTYLSNSILAKVDYRNLYLASAGLYISVENGDTAVAASVAEAYRMVMLNSDCMRATAEEMKIQEKYLWELVSISGYDRTQSSPMLRIYACGQSAEQAQLLLENLLSKLDEFQPKVAESTVPHKTGLIYGGINTTVSAELARHQESEMDRLEKYQAELEKLMLPANTPSAPAAPENPLKGAVKDAIIFAILGGAAGVFLVAAAACVGYLLGDKVYSGEDIRSRSGIRLLGKVALRPSKKNPIDRWLDRMENRPVFDDKPAFTMLAASIANYSADARPVMITGNASDELLQKFTGLLRAELPDLPIVYCGGLLSSVDAVKQLPSCGSVLLVECCGHSRYSAVAKQMDIAGGMDKLILGVVALEA